MKTHYVEVGEREAEKYNRMSSDLVRGGGGAGKG